MVEQAHMNALGAAKSEEPCSRGHSSDCLIVIEAGLRAFTVIIQS